MEYFAAKRKENDNWKLSMKLEYVADKLELSLKKRWWNYWYKQNSIHEIHQQII
jgi:hypothetical protein